MNRVRRWLAVEQERIPWLVGGVGVGSLLVFVIETAAFSGLDPDLVLTQEVAVGFLTALPFALGVVYGGYWLATSNVEPVRYPRVAGWCAGGTATFFALNVVLAVAFPPDTLWMTVGWLRATATWGAAGGLLAGLIEARAIQHAIEAERESMRAAYQETQREAIDYLNGLLRHEVLNAAQVITGYTSVLLDTAEGERKRVSHLETIQRQSEDMTAVVEDIRLLIEAMRGDAPLRPVNLSAVLRTELQKRREVPTEVTIDADIPDGVTVRADGFLPRIFSNLFDNAVEHNDSEEPHISVALETGDDRATVRVTDDGPGIPATMQADLFDRDDLTHSEYGLGLVLVERLVDRYGGTVELAATGPGGSTFAIELPLAADDVPDAGSIYPGGRADPPLQGASDGVRGSEKRASGARREGARMGRGGQ